MEKNLYIDASHPNEIRIVLKSGEKIEDYEYEGIKNNLIKKVKNQIGKDKVICALSGGVDSSVVAQLLKIESLKLMLY